MALNAIARRQNFQRLQARRPRAAAADIMAASRENIAIRRRRGVAPYQHGHITHQRASASTRQKIA